MAALSSTVPTAAGTTWTPAAVAASDTISSAILGDKGAYLVVINGGASSDTVTVSDSGLTPGGNVASAATVAVAAGASKAIYVSPRKVNPSTGVVTVTHSSTTSVTYVLVPAS